MTLTCYDESDLVLVLLLELHDELLEGGIAMEKGGTRRVHQ